MELERNAILSFWRSVFERRAPNSIGPIETLIAPDVIGQGNTISKCRPSYSRVDGRLRRSNEGLNHDGDEYGDAS